MSISIELLSALKGGPFKALTEYKQFILWEAQLDSRSGKIKKVPKNPQGRNHRNDDTNIWMDFRTAIAAAERTGFNLGFAIGPNDPFFYLDLDGCITETGEFNETAQWVNKTLPGAAREISISGRGLHFLGRYNEKPQGFQIKADDGTGVELFTEGRWVTLTGNGATGDANTLLQGPIQTVVAKWAYQVRDANVIDVGPGSLETQLRLLTTNDTPDMDELREALGHVPADERAVWFRVGLAIKSIKGYPEAEMFKLWDDWSKTSDNYGGTDDAWQEMGEPRSITYRSIFDLAKKHNPEYSPAPKKAEVQRPQLKPANQPNPQPQTKLAAVPKPRGFGRCWGSNWTKEQVAFPHMIGDRERRPASSFQNFRWLIYEWGRLRPGLNLMNGQVEVGIPGLRDQMIYGTEQNSELTVLESACRATELTSSEGLISKYLDLLASERPFHPVKDWIDSYQWDGIDRIEPLIDSLDAENRDLAGMFLRKWLHTAVKMAYVNYRHPGVAAQGLLVLIGPQGVGKTTWAQVLTGGHEEFFLSSRNIDPLNKDSIDEATDKWIVELGEVGSTLKRKEIDLLKAFITSPDLVLRKPYARKSITKPRRTIFIATGNDENYLVDDTGNRRFWTIKTGPKLNALHGIEMGQLWAQVRDQLYLPNPDDNLGFSREELTGLNEYNRKFERMSAEEDRFWDVFVDSPSETWTDLMSASEILKALDLPVPPVGGGLQRASQRIEKILGKGSKVRRKFKVPKRRNSVKMEGTARENLTK